MNAKVLWLVLCALGLTACVPIAIALSPMPAGVVVIALPPRATPTRVAATSTSVPPTATAPVATPVKYSSVDLGFTVSVPQGWVIAKEWPGRPTSSEQSTGVRFATPEEEVEILIAARLHQNRTAADWMDNLEAQPPPEYQRLSRETIQFQDVQAVKVIATFNSPRRGPQKTMTIVLVRSQFTYQISFFADLPVWEQYARVFDEFLNGWAWHTTLLVRDTPTPVPASPTPVSFLRQAYVLKVPKGTVLGSTAGPVVASTAPDSTMTLWDVATGKKIGNLQESPGKVEGIALSPDRRLLATLSDYTVTLRGVASGKKKYTLEMHSSKSSIEYSRVVGFSPDGRIVAATSNDDTFTLWKAASGKVLHTIEAGDWVRDFAFSPDGRIVAAGLNWSRQIMLWDAITGQAIPVHGKHESEVFAVAFSPDGRAVASGGTNGLVKIWDVASGQEIRAFGEESLNRGKSDYWVNALAFLVNGRYLASETFDNTVKLWDVALGRQVAAFQGFNIAAGRYLLSRTADGTERLWEVDVQALEPQPEVTPVPTFTPRPTNTLTPLPTKRLPRSPWEG